VRLPLLALFVRSVRQDVRSAATYWARAGLGVFLLLVLLVIALFSSWTGAPGRGFFISIITLQMMAITFVGLSYFASAIAEEKEEQTLGLLRMTGLDSLSILLGKSTSRLCGALLFITAQLPFTIFAITLGGVSLRQIAAAYCTLIAFTFFLGNVALLGSVLARRTGGAVVFCLCTPIILAVAWAILKGLHLLLNNYYGLHWPLDHVAAVIPAASPIARLEEIFGTGFSGPPIGRQVITDVAFGTGYFLLAWAAFERLCDRTQDQAFAVSRTPPTSRGAKRRFYLRWLQPPRAWKDALLWKDFYFVHGGRAAFALRTLFYGGVVLANAWQFTNGGSPTSSMNINTGTTSILPFLFSIDLAIMTSRIFRIELNEQTFAALIVLPCTVRQIANRKVLACLLAAAPGALSTIADQTLFLGDSSGGFAKGSMHPAMFVGLLSGWAAVVLLMGVVAWLSLTMRRGAAPLGCVLTGALSVLVTLICMMVVSATAAALSYPAPWLQSLDVADVVAPTLTAVLSIGAAWMLRGLGLVRLEELTREN